MMNEAVYYAVSYCELARHCSRSAFLPWWWLQHCSRNCWIFKIMSGRCIMKSLLAM